MGCCEGKLPNPDERLAADSSVAFGSLDHRTQLAQARPSEASNSDRCVCVCALLFAAFHLEPAVNLVRGQRAVSPCCDVELRFLKVHAPRPGGPFLPCSPVLKPY